MFITSNDTEAEIKSLPPKKDPGSEGLMTELYQTLKKKVLIQTLLKFFLKIENEGVPNSFYEASIILNKTG